MNQDLIVLAIIGLTICYTGYSLIRSLTSKKTKSGCDGCSGCAISKDKISCRL